jgi:fermentation-respiration switch protein FrsA (DUF1100 family)
MRHRYKKKKGKKLLCCFVFFCCLLYYHDGGASLVFSEISKTIGTNGLLKTNTSGFDAIEALAVSDFETAGTKQESGLGDIACVGEDVTVLSEDGFELSGVLYRQSQDNGRWAVVVHGYSSHKEAMEHYAGEYFENGYNVLSPDCVHMETAKGILLEWAGLTEKTSCYWIESIDSKHPSASIVLHGVSMGGAAVIMASGEQLPSNVAAIIEDSGYTSVWDILKYQLKHRYKLPAFPALYAANLWSEGKWGYNWKEASAVNQVKKSSTPVLFIHGGNDSVVPTEMVYTLYQAAECKKRLLVIEEAEHAQAAMIDPERYWTEVFAFIQTA